MTDVDVLFLFWNVKNVKVDLMVNVKRKICTEKCTNNSLEDLSIGLNNHDWHC